ncbi:MAG: phosphopentomutase [Deltaproteobacteria bacterium]|nr:phosphopentomutase [Deltaproteobacteria bacterium]
MGSPPASSAAASSVVRRAIVIVLDSVGCGAAPDAAKYGDEGANTLGHIAQRVCGMTLPYLQKYGLGNITTVLGVPPAIVPAGAFGMMREASAGKDTSTGHWEMAGLWLAEPFCTFPTGFPGEIIDAFKQRAGRGVLGNKAASGTEIIEELGPLHARSGDFIVYTSADSVFQVAAHEEVVPLDELYRACKIAREILDPYHVGRVIARPFVGAPGQYQRTYNRKDFSMLPPEPTVLDAIREGGMPVVGVGKIGDIFAGQGLTEDVHTEGNADGLRKTLELMDRVDRGLIFVNLVDFDMLYGHRNNPSGYYKCLREFDAFLPAIEAKLRAGDLVVLTADHGNDPTTPGTDHTREHVPLLVFGPSCAPGRALGTRSTFADVGATLAEAFGVRPPPHGTSFLGEIA